MRAAAVMWNVLEYYAAALARQLELPDLDQQAVEIAALLHDIGKLAGAGAASCPNPAR